MLGFDQFSPVQIRILTQLARRVEQFAIYLLWDVNRPEDSLALSRIRQTRAALERAIPLDVGILGEEPTTRAGLAHLRAALFETDAKKADPREQVQFLEAPSREREVRWALREIKRLLLVGVPARQIAILSPNPNTYTPIIRAVATEYGLPIKTRQPLANQPVVTALRNLLSLPPEFPWRETFDALRDPYIEQPWLTPEQINVLDQLSRERPVLSGRRQWQFALTPLELETQDSEDEDLRPPPLVAELPPKELEALQEGLTAFFDHLTPPQKLSYRAYTWWLQTAILGLIPPVEGLDEDPIPESPSLEIIACAQHGLYPKRDQKALAQVLKAMRRVMASAETIPDGDEISWETYRDELLGLIDAMVINPDPLEAQVRFAHLADGRARIVDHLYILGLSEGEFPQPPAPDPLYATEERSEHPLPLIHPTPADDASLWWQVISNCRKRLSLSRPYIDENGAPWQASPYWSAVLACLQDPAVERLPIAPRLDPDEAASHSELLTALAASNAQSVPQLLLSLWHQAHQADAVMKQRQSDRPPKAYEGVIQTDPIKAAFAQRYGPGHIWSASRLNRYNNCPYGFYAQYILDLEARLEPEEGMDALQRGSVLHAVLEQFNRQVAEDEIPLTEAHFDELFERLDGSCEQVFSDAPRRYGFRPGALWDYEQTELKRMLVALIRWECEQNGPQARFRPYLAEAGFGIGTGSPPLEIHADDLSFKLRGMIDRVDRNQDGNLRVIDYKSGSTKKWTSDLKKGLALQTALYAYAAETFWTKADRRVVESAYLHIPKRETSGKLDFEDHVRENPLAETAISKAAAAIRNICKGVFPSAPAKPSRWGRSCRQNCEFASLCRVSRQSIAKARAEELI